MTFTPGSKARQAARAPSGARSFGRRCATPRFRAPAAFRPLNWVPPVDGPRRPAARSTCSSSAAAWCGQTAAFALARDGVRAHRASSTAQPRGREGPWGTYARMDNAALAQAPDRPRSRLPRAARSAPGTRPQHGAEGWQRLYKVATADWLAYLLWVRDTACQSPSRTASRRRWIDLRPGASFASQLAGPRAPRPCTRARSFWPAGAMASGAPLLRRRSPRWRARAGCAGSASSTPPTSIDFARFKGGEVGVLGASASAFDNAAVALGSWRARGAPVLARRAPAAGQQVEMDGLSRVLPRLSRSRR